MTTSQLHHRAKYGRLGQKPHDTIAQHTKEGVVNEIIVLRRGKLCAGIFGKCNKQVVIEEAGLCCACMLWRERAGELVRSKRPLSNFDINALR